MVINQTESSLEIYTPTYLQRNNLQMRRNKLAGDEKKERKIERKGEMVNKRSGDIE